MTFSVVKHHFIVVNISLFQTEIHEDRLSTGAIQMHYHAKIIMLQYTSVDRFELFVSVYFFIAGSDKQSICPFLYTCCLLGPLANRLTHWGRVTHICVSKVTIIGSDNGLSPGRRQAIIWTNASILLIRPLGTNFSEILIGIQTFSYKKMYLKMSSAKWRPFCLALNVLTHIRTWISYDIHCILWCVHTHPCPDFDGLFIWL